MRIAFVVRQFPVLSEMFIANSAVALLQAGHDVQIHCLWYRNDASVLNPAARAAGLMARTHAPATANQGWWARALALPGAFVSVASTQGPAVALSAFHPSAHRLLAARLHPIHELAMWNRLPRPDVIHCQFGMVAEPMLRHTLAGAFDAALVTHFRGHDLDPWVRARGPDVYRRLFGHGDGFIANGRFFRDRAIALGCPADRIGIAESPVDISHWPWRPPEPPSGRPVRLLTVARLTEKKGIEQVIAAVALLRSRGVEASYRVVGEGRLRPLLEEQIARLGLGDHVMLLGGHPHDVVQQELARADLFLAPSQVSSTGESDAATNTLKEAMLSGPPVIATWHGGIPELVAHGVSGLLVPERDPPAIAGAVEQMLANPGLWGPMSARARQAVEQRFSFPAIAGALLSLYEQALARRDARRARPQMLNLSPTGGQ